MREGRSLSRQSQDIIGRGKTRCLVTIIKDCYRTFSWILLDLSQYGGGGTFGYFRL